MERRVEAPARDPSGPSGPALPYERLRAVVPAMVGCLVAMALFLLFLIESLRGDQLTLSFEIAGLPVSDAEILHNHDRLTRDTTIVALLAASVAILWLVWQYRAHANLRAMVPGMRFRPVAAVLLWLVPVVNLVGPPLALRELWKASDVDHEDWRKTWTTPLLWLWWLVLLASLALGWWALAPTWHDRPTLEELLVRDHRAVIAAGVGVLSSLAAAVLFVLLHLRITGREDRVMAGQWRGWTDRRPKRR